jgi:hypothetical protein
LRAIGSAAAIAESEGYELVIVWEPDEYCNCYFHDLFDYSGPVIDCSLYNLNKDNIKVFNYMHIEDGKTNELIDCSLLKDVYVKSALTLCLQALSGILKIDFFGISSQWLMFMSL